jgi:threonine/homoserine/homoserine lactone efflux protein
MVGLSPLALAALTGGVSGLLLSIPVGPINLTILNEGARRGFRWAVLIGLGASAMEVIYCALAFTGFAAFFAHPLVKAGVELFSFGFLLFLGMKFLLARTLMPAPKIEERIEERLQPHSAFMTGFVRTLGNPGVLLFWLVLAANFLSRGWVGAQAADRLACVGGVAVGTSGWFLGLSWAVSLGHGRLREQTLLRMERISGVGLLLLALLHGGHLAWQLAKHRM